MYFPAAKKVYAYILTVFVFVLSVSTSCTKKTKSNDDKTVFDTIQVNKTQSIDYKKSKLNCNLHIAFTYPVECNKTSSLSDLQKIFVENFFPQPNQFADLTPKNATDSFSAQYIRNFQSVKVENFFKKEDDDDYILEDENNFMYELSLENEILFNTNRFISFVVKNINYEGGAHGSNTIHGYVINLETGKLLTEDDFAGNNYKKNLSSLIVQKIAAAKGLDSIPQLEDIGYNSIEDIAPNGNFTIDDKGITYYYNEYDIAAYFVGTTVVFIPYEELKAYISDDSPISSLAGR